MALTADQIVDRRRLKRQISLWRLAAIGLVVLLIVGSSAFAGLFEGNRIAVLPVHGVILGDPALVKTLDALHEDDRVKGVILDIDSPGGGTAASEELYLKIRELSAKKPVVATMGTLAASGGYITAIAADHIIARRNTITGSIGVIFQSTEFSKLFDNVGVGVEQIASGPRKGEPSIHEPLSEEGRKALEAVVLDSYAWFVGLVAERRGLDPVRTEQLADGRIYSGGQALELGLVDAMGGQDEAVDWMAKERGLDAGLPVVRVSPQDAGLDFADMAAELPARIIQKVFKTERLTLDGLVSVWHAPVR
jgi:protease-4